VKAAAKQAEEVVKAAAKQAEGKASAAAAAAAAEEAAAEAKVRRCLENEHDIAQHCFVRRLHFCVVPHSYHTDPGSQGELACTRTFSWGHQSVTIVRRAGTHIPARTLPNRGKVVVKEMCDAQYARAQS